MRELTSLFSQSIIYSAGNVAAIMAGFLLLPLYTRYLLPHEYGVVEMLNVFLQIAGILFALGLGSALFKCYYFDCKGEEERKELFGTSFVFLLLFCTLCSVPLLLLSLPLSKLLVGSKVYRECFCLAVGTNIFRTLLLLPLALYRAQERPLPYVLCVLAQLLLNIALNAFFVVYLRWGILGIWRGNLLSSIIATVLSFISTRRWMRLRLRTDLLYSLLAFGLPIMPTSIFGWMMTVVDRYFLQHFRTLHEVGLYAVGYKIGMLTQIAFVFPFSLAWPPFVMKVAKQRGEKEAKDIFSKVFFYLTLLLLAATFTLSMYKKEIVSLIATPFYVEAASIVPIVLLCYLLNAWYICFCVGINVRFKVRYLPLLSLLGAASNLLFNLWLIPLYGMRGAAFATLLSYILMVAASYILSQSMYRVSYPIQKVFVLILICILALLAGGSLNFLQKVLVTTLCLCAMVLFTVRWERLHIY